MPDPDGKVVPLFPGVKGDAELTKAERPPWCSHDHVQLDDEKHRVFCRDCRREIDAYDALEKFAAQWNRWRDRIENVKRETRVREGRLEEIKREEKNAKARLARVRKKLGPRSA